MKNTNVANLIIYSLLLLAVVWIGYIFRDGEGRGVVLDNSVVRKFEFEKLPLSQSDFDNKSTGKDRYAASGDLSPQEVEEGVQKIKELSVLERNDPVSAMSDKKGNPETVIINAAGILDKIKKPLMDVAGGDDIDIIGFNFDNRELNQETPPAQAVACGPNSTPGQQCGGGPAPIFGLGDCKAQTRLAFDYVCNYGNYPEAFGVPEPEGNISCSSVVSCTSPCSCGTVPSICGATVRCQVFGIPCTPVTCEQCCAGSAWLWDSVTGWCGCAR